MLIIKIIIFAVIVVIALALLIENLNKWTLRFREYMLGKTRNVFGDGVGWNKPWALFLSKTMIIFFVLMFIVGMYVFIFGIL